MSEEIKNPRLTEDEKKFFEQYMPEDMQEIVSTGIKRRHFLKLMAITGGGMMLFQLLDKHQLFAQSATIEVPNAATIERRP